MTQPPTPTSATTHDPGMEEDDMYEDVERESLPIRLKMGYLHVDLELGPKDIDRATEESKAFARSLVPLMMSTLQNAFGGKPAQASAPASKLETYSLSGMSDEQLAREVASHADWSAHLTANGAELQAEIAKRQAARGAAASQPIAPGVPAPEAGAEAEAQPQARKPRRKKGEAVVTPERPISQLAEGEPAKGGPPEAPDEASAGTPDQQS